jgi:uncharacterized protein YqeY
MIYPAPTAAEETMSDRTLRQRIEDDMKAAMKAGDKARLGALRMVKARMMEAEVALRGKKGRDYQLDDAEATQVLSSCAKQRRDSIDSFRHSPGDVGAVMKIVMPQVKGAADGKEVNRIIVELLGGKS